MQVSIEGQPIITLKLSTDEYRTLRKLVYQKLSGTSTARETITRGMEEVDRDLGINPATDLSETRI